MAELRTLPIEAVTYDEARLDRRRTDDLDELAAGIQAHGRVCPISVADDNSLVAGLRRLLACKRLNHRTIDAWVVNAEDDVRIRTFTQALDDPAPRRDRENNCTKG